MSAEDIKAGMGMRRAARQRPAPRVDTTFECESALDYRRLFADVAWTRKLASLPPGDADRFKDAVAAAGRPYTGDGRIRLVAASLRACGRK
jgi:hypothetical protein